MAAASYYIPVKTKSLDGLSPSYKRVKAGSELKALILIQKRYRGLPHAVELKKIVSY